MTGALIQKFKGVFYRAAEFENEIGPQLEILSFEAKNKTYAVKLAKEYAKAMDWRFLHIELPDGKQVSK